MISKDLNRPLKVVLLAKWYPDRKDPQLGVFIQKHAQCIGETCNVTVFHARSDENLKAGHIESEYRVNEGVKESLWYYGPYKGLMRPFNAITYWRCWKRFKKSEMMAIGKPDVFHAYIQLRTGSIAMIESMFSGIPYVVSEQWSGYATGEFGKKPFWWRWIWKKTIHHARGVSSVSLFLKEKIEQLSGRKDLRVFHNVIEAVKPGDNGPSGREPFILMVADLVDEIKNISGVIKAYAELKPTIPLKIIGGGKDREKLEDYCRINGIGKHEIIFEGLQPNSVVYERLKECAFLLMNSRFETFSSVCAEALVCGKPVIATRCGGPQEFIGSGQGILIDPDHHEQLKEALRTMLAGYRNYDPKRLNQYASERFGKSGIGKAFRSWYQDALRS